MTGDPLTGALDLLACPRTGQALRVAPVELVARLNALVALRALREASGAVVREPMDTGLVTVDGAWCYPVRGGVAVLELGRAMALIAVDEDPSKDESSA